MRPVAETDVPSARSRMARARLANPAATLGRRNRASSSSRCLAVTQTIRCRGFFAIGTSLFTRTLISPPWFRDHKLFPFLRGDVLRTRVRQTTIPKPPRTRANASNLLHSRGAGQGFRKKIGVQGGSFAFAGDAVFPRMLLEQAQRHFAHQGEVLSRVTVLDATLILTEADIQLPM